MLIEIIMCRAKIICNLLMAGFLAISGVAQALVATTTTYHFGNLLTSSDGCDVPLTANFATLEATDYNNGAWQFTLSIDNNLFSTFGDNAFIGSMSFDFTPDPIYKPVSTFVASNLDGVTAVYSTKGTGNSGLPDIDFGTKFGKGSRNRLSQSDYVTWDVTGLVLGSSLTNMYVHVQGIAKDIYGCNKDTDDCSAKYTSLAPIPEPENYTMMLVGLGLLGFAARRRKSGT